MDFCSLQTSGELVVTYVICLHSLRRVLIGSYEVRETTH